MRLIFWLCIFLFYVPSWAHQPADGHVYATLGAFTYMTHKLDHEFQSPIVLGPSFTAEADVTKYGGLEIGMFYLDNPFSVLKDGKTVVERIKRIYITTGYRHWFKPDFSIALAFSSSYIMGDSKIMRDDFQNVNRPHTSAHDITEYGIDGSVQYEPWQDGRWALVIDGRYGYSLTPKRGEDANHYGAFVALKYFVQAREKIEDEED